MKDLKTKPFNNTYHMTNFTTLFQTQIARARFLTFLLLGIFFTSSTAIAQGTWTTLANTAPHQNLGVLVLLSDGTVICHSNSGGGDGYGNTWDKLTPNASGSYANGTWSSIAPMASTRLHYSCQVLKDGRVYVCGGEYGTGGYKGEVYNPLTNSWTSAPNQTSFVSDANSEILEDGRVLQAIVWAEPTTKIYNPATNTYTNGPNALGSNNESSWLKLPDNSILYVTVNGTQSQRYIPATNTWIADANCAVNLYDPYGSEAGGCWLLPDGRGFFIGATGHTAFYTPSGTTAPGTWAAGPDLPGGLATPDAPGCMMPDGRILLALSPAPTAAQHFPKPTSFYTYDYLTNSYTSVLAPGGGASINKESYTCNMLQLPNGQVLLGIFSSNQYYVFTPSGSNLTAYRPVISGITQIAANTYRITGTRFNGISEGDNYGDDQQNATNYPVIRLTNGANVYYCRSYNWNSTGVRRSAPDTAYFTTPAGLPNATYNLVVTANGNPSLNTTFVPNLVASVDIAISSGNNPGCDGNPVTFIATPNNGGATPTYQWKLNGVAISGATNYYYTTSTSLQSDVITCVMTASIVVTGSPATSNPITMEVNDNNAVITSSATPSTLCKGASASLAASIAYCQPTYTTGAIYGDYIGRVAITGTTLNNITLGAGSPFYTLYPASGSTTASLTVGTTYTLVLAPGTYGSNNQLAAWIDYNQDKSFSGDEKLGQVLINAAYPTTANIVFTVPATAKNGQIRLRVREAYSNLNIDPCKSWSFGETEDYLLTLSGGGTATAIVFDWANGTSPASGTPVTGTPDYSQTYTVTVTDVHGCTTNSTAPVVVNSPNINAIASPVILCSGATSSLSVSKVNSYCYPISVHGTAYGDYITKVNISGTTLNNTTGASASPFYTVYPASGATTTTLTAGGTYALILAAGSYPSYNNIAAFLDFDGDYILNTGLEKLGETGYINASPATGTITFTVPLWAKNGLHRLRIREAYGTTGIDPCTQYYYGETEDYDVTITGGINEIAYTYSWSAGTTPSTGTPVTVTPISSSQYTVTATDQYGCTSTDAASVIVSSPDFTLNASPAVICQGATSTLTAAIAPLSFCQPYYSAGTYEGDYISQVTIPGTTLNNISVGEPSPYYILYPASGSTTATLTAGSTYTITLGAGSYTYNNLAAWIDYDQNGLFYNPLEKLGETIGLGTGVTTSFVFTVPSYAQNGIARLRVREAWAYTNMDACAASIFGETEDYDLTITGGSAADTYAWSAGTTPATGNSVTASPASSQNYTVTATDGFGCTKTGTVSVVVNSPAFLTVAAPPEICAGGSSSLTAISNYCQPNYIYGTGSGDYITLVSIAGTPLNNPTGPSGSPFYTLYPASGATTASLSAGSTYTITLSPGTYSSNNNLAAWIDYDQNSELSAGIEKLGETGWVAGLSTNTFVFTVPAWAKNGQTRLRVREVYNNTNLSSCNNSNVDYYGETEDYTITITGGVAATAGATFSWSAGTTPTTGSPVSVTPAYSQSYTVTATDAAGCTRTGTVPVLVHDLPGVVATAAPSTICSGAFSILTASSPSLAAYCIPTYYSGSGFGDYIGSVALSGTTLNNVTTGAASPFYTLYPASGTTTASLYAGSTYTLTLGSGTFSAYNNLAAWIDYDQNHTLNAGLEKLGETGFIAGSSTGSFVFTVPTWAINGTTRLRVREIYFASGLTSCDAASFGETEDYDITISGGVSPTATNYSWAPTTSPATGAVVNASPAVNTTYTVTASDYYGCSNTTSALITVIPNVSASATSSTICLGGSTTLNASGPGTYTWQPGGLSGASVTVSPTTTTTYTVTGTAPGTPCISTATVTITVNPLPTIGTTVTSASICIGSSTSITGTGGVSYTWQPGALSGTSITVTPIASTTYTVTGTGSNGCSNTATRLISVNPLPSVGTTVTNTSICIGSSTSLTGTGAATYTWQPGALSGTTVTVSPAATTTYTVTGTSAAGCVATATVTITVNPLPSVGTTVTASSICVGSNTTMTGTGALTYTWNPGALSGLSVTVSPATTTTYTIVGTSAAGCTASATRVITVNPLPSVGASASVATICNGTPTTLTGTGAVTYIWNPGGLSGTPVSVAPAATTTYTVIGTNANGCTNTSTVAIAVNALPSVGTTVTSTTLCAGQSTSITGTGASTYSWNPGSLSGITINVTPGVTTTYTVTGTAANGCTASATRLITVNPLPNVGTTVTNASICVGSSTSITGTGADTYAWNPGALSGVTITVSPAANTTYTVTGTNATTGCTNTATRTITVNALPVVGITVTNATICAGSSTSLTGTGATTYTWQPGALSGTTVSVSPATTTTYTVTGTNTATGCTNTATTVITVNALPVVGTTITSATICAGQSTSITGTGASTYSWNPGALSGTTIIVAPGTTTTYTVTGTAANGCTASATRLVTVNPIPVVGTTVTSASICTGQSTSMTGTGASTYTWNPGALSGITVTVSPATTTTYTVTGTSAAGCVATATRLITVNPLPTVGTTVTNATICLNTSTNITGTGAVTYVWNPGGIGGTTITVSPATTTTYTVIGTSAAGCTASSTRLITVNTPPSVGTTATLTSLPCGGSTTLTGTGASTYSWQPGGLSGISVTVSPATTTTYTVTGTGANGCTATSTRTITVAPCITVLNLKFYIEGFYLSAGNMTPALLNQGQPNLSSDADTVTVELHNAAPPYTLAQSYTNVLKTNGTINCIFTPAATGGSYYIVLKHRNSVETWSANPVLMSPTTTYDFSNLASKAYNSNQYQVGTSPAVWAIFAGDINLDQNVDLLDLSMLENSISLFDYGYQATDLNGDGNVDLLDAPILEENINNFIYSNHP